MSPKRKYSQTFVHRKFKIFQESTLRCCTVKVSCCRNLSQMFFGKSVLEYPTFTPHQNGISSYYYVAYRCIPYSKLKLLVFFLVLICKCFGLGAFWHPLSFQTSHTYNSGKTDTVSTKRFNNYLNKCLQKSKLPWSPPIISFFADNLTGCSLKCPAVNCQDEVFGNCGALLLQPRELLKKLLLAGRPTAREQSWYLVRPLRPAVAYISLWAA